MAPTEGQIIDIECTRIYNLYKGTLEYGSLEENVGLYKEHFEKFNRHCNEKNYRYIVRFKLLKMCLPCCPNIWYDVLKRYGIGKYERDYMLLELYSEHDSKTMFLQYQQDVLFKMSKRAK